jgi:hypothetical protein
MKRVNYKLAIRSQALTKRAEHRVKFICFYGIRLVGVGVGVGFGVGVGLGLTVGLGEGLGEGLGDGLGDGDGFGVGVGVGFGMTSSTPAPFDPA